MEETLTIKQAYIAMFIYLDSEYQLTQSNDIAELLSPMAIMQDGLPVDNAIWQKWIDCVNKARDDKNWDIAKFELT